MEKIDSMNSLLEQLNKTVVAQQQKIVQLESTVSTLNNDVLLLKNMVNSREQELRANSIRVTGFPFTEEEKTASDSKLLCKKLYDRVLGPILNAAKAKGHIDKLPALSNCIIDAYRVGVAAAKPGSTSPPPIVIKLLNSTIKVAIMRNKREATPGPSDAERAAGFKKIYVAEDLTPPAFRKLKELQQCEDVSKAWSVDGRIRLVMRDSTSVFKVLSVFEDVKAILKKASK